MEYIKKQLEPRGTLGGFVAFHNGLQPVQWYNGVIKKGIQAISLAG